MSQFGRALLILNLAIGLALVGSWLWNPPQPKYGADLSDSVVPRIGGGYVSQGDETIPKADLDALPGAKLLARRYAGPAAPIDFTVVEGTNRTALHDPRYCLTGAGWQLSDDHTERIAGPDGAQIDICRAATQIGQPPDVTVAYMYLIGDRVIASPTAIRATLLWSAVFGTDSMPIYFLRFVQPLGVDRQAQAANHTALIAFAQSMEHAIRARQQQGIGPAASRPAAGTSREGLAD